MNHMVQNLVVLCVLPVAYSRRIRKALEKAKHDTSKNFWTIMLWLPNKQFNERIRREKIFCDFQIIIFQ